jgi:cobalt-zinc-cadmium efflux system membrane fusion protein
LAKGVLGTMMISHLKTAALVLCLMAVLGFGAGALATQGGAPVPLANREQAEAATRVEIKQTTPSPSKPEDRAAYAAIERRLTEMDRKLDDLTTLIQALPRESGKPLPLSPRIDAASFLKIRPRFDSLVEEVHVKVGQRVKVGDPLVDLYSTDLAKAKNDCQTKYVQWQHDENLYDLRQKLVATGAISQQLWVDTKNDEQKSRLDFNIAQDNLTVFYEVPMEEIGAIKDGKDERKARFTLRSPVNGTTIEVCVGPGDLSDPKSILLVISPTKP